MNICIVTGARPNIIKVAPIVIAIERHRESGSDINVQLVYTGRADDNDLEASLFDDLQLRHPDFFLEADSNSMNELTGMVMLRFDRYLDNHATDIVVVVDDLASTMATAIVTKKRGLKLVHLVAGTRSFDINMPKEINRLVIDALSDILFTAGDGASSIATREGAELSKIYNVGNILMDTLRMNANRFRRPQCMDTLHLAENGYIVLTLNRKALLNDDIKLMQLLSTLTAKTREAGIPVLALLRGSTLEKVKSVCGDSLAYLGPLPYLEFGYLTAHAMGIVTDSGNVAEEATFNNIPCITLNRYTEHIETVKLGTNVLTGEDSKLLGDKLTDMLAGRWKSASLPDRWDGRTAERMVQILMKM